MAIINVTTDRNLLESELYESDGVTPNDFAIDDGITLRITAGDTGIGLTNTLEGSLTGGRIYILTPITWSPINTSKVFNPNELETLQLVSFLAPIGINGVYAGSIDGNSSSEFTQYVTFGPISADDDDLPTNYGTQILTGSHLDVQIHVNVGPNNGAVVLAGISDRTERGPHEITMVSGELRIGRPEDAGNVVWAGDIHIESRRASQNARLTGSATLLGTVFLGTYDNIDSTAYIIPTNTLTVSNCSIMVANTDPVIIKSNATSVPKLVVTDEISRRQLSDISVRRPFEIVLDPEFGAYEAMSADILDITDTANSGTPEFSIVNQQNLRRSNVSFSYSSGVGTLTFTASLIPISISTDTTIDVTTLSDLEQYGYDVEAGFTLTLNTTGASVDLTYDQPITGDGDWVKTGEGGITLQGDADVDEIGSVSSLNINGGFIGLGDRSLITDITVGASGNLIVSNTTTVTGDTTINGQLSLTSSAILITSGQFTNNNIINIVGTGRLVGREATVLSSTSIVNITGSVNSSGTVSQGFLAVSSTTTTPPATLSLGGTLNFQITGGSVSSSTLIEDFETTASLLLKSTDDIISDSFSSVNFINSYDLVDITSAPLVINDQGYHVMPLTISNTIKVDTDETLTTLNALRHYNIAENQTLTVDTTAGAITSGVGYQVFANGNIIKTGAFELEIIGQFSANGDISVNQGTLKLNSVHSQMRNLHVNDSATFDSSTVNMNGPLSGAGTIISGSHLNYLSDSSSTFDGIINASGGINKRGNSILTLTGVNTCGLTSGIAVGELVIEGTLNGNMELGDINNSSDGGKLSGSGIINGNVISTVYGSNTFAPGSSIGTMTINGDLTLTSNSKTEIELNSSEIDLIIVTGDITLDGELVLQPEVDTYSTNTLQFINGESSNSLVGEFISHSTENESRLDDVSIEVRYDVFKKDVYIELSSNAGVSPTPGGGTDQSPDVMRPTRSTEVTNIIDRANRLSLQRSVRIRRAISNSGYVSQQVGSPSFFELEADLPLLDKNDFRTVEKELLSLEDGVQFLNTSLASHLGVTNLEAGSNLEPVMGEAIRVVLSGGLSTGNEIQLINVHTDASLDAGDFIQFGNQTKVFQVSEDTRAPHNGNMLVKLHTPIITNFTEDGGIAAAKVEVYTFTAGAGGDQAGVFVLNDRNGLPTQYSLPSTVGSVGALVQFINDNVTGATAAATTANDFAVTFSLAVGDATLEITTGTRTNQLLAQTSVTTSPTDTYSQPAVAIGNDVQFKFMLTERPSNTIVPGTKTTNLYQYDTFTFREVL